MTNRNAVRAMTLVAVISSVIAVFGPVGSAGGVTTRVSGKESSRAYPPLGPAPTWGACGLSDSPNKVVAKFPGGVRLTCGTESFGYRHILKRHRMDFTAKASPTNMNWRDLVHWAIHYNMVDPDKVIRQNSYTTCRNRDLYLKNLSGGAYIPSTFRIAYNHNTLDVITAFPGSPC